MRKDLLVSSEVSKKVLLVYDDYAEMIRVQTDLMKVGFDVVGIVNEVLLADQVLSFYPDLIITAGRGGKVSAPRVAQKLKENSRYTGKLILLLPPTQRMTADELAKSRMDALLEPPIPMEKLLQVISRVLGLEQDVLKEKFQKLRPGEAFAADVSNQMISGGGPSASSGPEDSQSKARAARFEMALKGLELDPRATTFDRKEVKAHQEELKKDWDFKELGKLDELKQAFVRALFRKK